MSFYKNLAALLVVMLAAGLLAAVAVHGYREMVRPYAAGIEGYVWQPGSDLIGDCATLYNVASGRAVARMYCISDCNGYTMPPDYWDTGTYDLGNGPRLRKMLEDHVRNGAGH